MHKKTILGIGLIFIGILIVLAGIREFIQILIIEQIPIIGDIIQLIAPTALRDQLIEVLAGLVLIFVGGIIAKRKKN